MQRNQFINQQIAFNDSHIIVKYTNINFEINWTTQQRRKICLFVLKTEKP